MFLFFYKDTDPQCNLVTKPTIKKELREHTREIKKCPKEFETDNIFR